MSCAEIEILICDYVDGTLTAADANLVESHLDACPACASLARDSRDAVEFMERAAAVEPPAELINKLLFDAPWSKQQKLASGARNWFFTSIRAVLHPRVVMGMAMTILSFSMLSKLTPVRQMTTADLQPAHIWSALENRSYRMWERSVKFYENLKFVYQIQSTLREWQQQQEEEQRTPGEADARQSDERKLPVKGAPTVPPGAGQASK